MGTTAVNIDKIKSFLDAFKAARSSRQQARLRRMDNFIAEFKATRLELRTSGPVDFNIFSLFGISTDEVKQSRFLAWLLDAESGHKHGTVFMEAFLKLCRINIPTDVLTRYYVVTEYSGAESRIDILIYRANEFIIYLENKVFAQEGVDQAKREFCDMRRLGDRLHIPRERQYAVFLTPTGRKPLTGDSSQWIAISYNAMRAELRKLLPVITDNRVKNIVNDWIDAVSFFGGTDGSVL